MRRNFCCLSIMLVLCGSISFGQEYYPKGDPKKLQVEITVPMWLPWVNGQVGVNGILKDVEAGISAAPADLISNLKAAIMANADISMSGFVGFVNYMKIVLEAESAPAQLPMGGSANWGAEIKNAVLDMAAGRRIRIKKGMLEPFLGVRYFNLNTAVELNVNSSAKTGTEKIDYWDPFLGTRLFYYPKQRLMLFFRTDVGGIWGGAAEFSWNVEGKVGYTVSPTLDIAGGFRTWRFEYAEFKNNERTFYLNPHFYGFEVSVLFMIPKRGNMD